MLCIATLKYTHDVLNDSWILLLPFFIIMLGVFRYTGLLFKKHKKYPCYRYEALVPGCHDFAAEYNSKIFLFASEEHLNKFLR